MRNTKPIPDIHTAFNPVVPVFRGTNETEAVLEVLRGRSDVVIAVLERDYLNNVVQFELSGLFANSFKGSPSWGINNNSEIGEDPNLYMPYKLRDGKDKDNYFGKSKTFSYYAINAVAQIGESSSLVGQRGNFLTNFDVLYVYEGYPADVAILGYSGGTYYNFSDSSIMQYVSLTHFLIKLKINCSQIDLLSATAWGPLQNNRGIDITDNNNEVITVISSDGSYPKTHKCLETRCVPQNPFYVKWINQQGGWDYWMFSFRQYISRNTKNSQTFEPTIYDQERAKYFIEEFYKEGVEKITVGAEGLNENEYQCISKLIYAPQIQYYNAKTKKWIGLIVDSGETENDTRSSSKEVEFTFLLPKPQIQF